MVCAVRKLFTGVFIFFLFSSTGWAVEEMDIVERGVDNFILWDVGNIEELCANHFDETEIKCEDDKTLEMLNHSNRNLMSLSPDLYKVYKEDIDRVQHDQEWQWAKGEAGKILNHLSNEIDYYDSFQEFHRNRDKQNYNLDYDLTKARLSLGVQALVAKQLELKQLKRNLEDIAVCMGAYSGNGVPIYPKNCGDINSVKRQIKASEDDLVELYGNEPLLAQPGFQNLISKAVDKGRYDFTYESQRTDTFKSGTSRNMSSISDEAAFNAALSTSLFTLKRGLTEKFDQFYQMNSVPDDDRETQKKYLMNFEILNDLSPEGFIGDTNNNGAQCRLTQRYERLQQTKNLSKFVKGSALALGPGIALRVAKKAMSLGRVKAIFDSRAMLSASTEVGSYSLPMAAGVSISAEDLKKQIASCKKIEQNYMAWPGKESYEQYKSCKNMENTQRVTVALSVVAQSATLRQTTKAARDAAKVSLAKALREAGLNVSLQFYRTTTKLSPSVRQFVSDYARRDDLYTAGENVRFMQAISTKPDKLEVALEDTFSALKPMNDEGPGKLFSDALRNFRLDRLQKNIKEGLEDVGVAPDKYADFKVTAVLQEAGSPEEQEKIYQALVSAYQKTDTETLSKIASMPAAKKLIDKLAEKNPSFEFDQLFHGGIHKTRVGEEASSTDKAAMVAKKKIQSGTRPKDFKEVEQGIMDDVSSFESNHRAALSNIPEDSRLLETVTLPSGKEVQTLSVEAIGRLRKIHTPRIRDGSDMESLSNQVYFSDVKRVLEQISGDKLSDEQVRSIVSSYRFGNDFAMTPRFSGNREMTEFSNYNVTFDGKGLGAEGIQMQMAYTLGLEAKTADKFISVSRQAEQAVTANKERVVQEIQSRLNEALSPESLQRLGDGKALRVQVSGDDYKVGFKAQPTEEELRIINGITDQKSLQGKLRATYTELTDQEIARLSRMEGAEMTAARNKAINARVDVAEKSEKKFQEYFYYNFDQGKAPKVDVMVSLQKGKNMPSRIDYDFATRVTDKREIQKIIQTYKQAVPYHRRGIINIPGQKPIDMRPGRPTINRIRRRGPRRSSSYLIMPGISVQSLAA